jgi:chromate transporter
MDQQNHLKEIAKLFLKLGAIGFGGPAAHIAMMQQEVVVKKKWLSQQHFLDLIGATNLIPGPNSTEMALHIGYQRAGRKGLPLAGLSFITPAVIITGFLAWLYKEYGQIPQVRPFLYGIKPAIIAVILSAIFPLAKKSLKTPLLKIVACTVLCFSLLNYNEMFLMFGSGIAALLIYSLKQNKEKKLNLLIPMFFFQTASPETNTVTNLKLLLIFFKIGALLYGSGYVLFAFLDAELVAKGFLTRTELMDAIAVGQFTPGPVFSAVTFIRYQINDFSGAFVSTIAVFLPSFIFVALLNPLVKKMRNSKLFSVFLDAINAASVAIILSVCIEMGLETIIDWKTVAIALLSIAITYNYDKINSAFIVLLGSLLGYILNLI